MERIWVLQWDSTTFKMEVFKEFKVNQDNDVYVNPYKMSIQNELYYYEVWYWCDGQCWDYAEFDKIVERENGTYEPLYWVDDTFEEIPLTIALTNLSQNLVRGTYTNSIGFYIDPYNDYAMYPDEEEDPNYYLPTDSQFFEVYDPVRFYFTITYNGTNWQRFDGALPLPCTDLSQDSQYYIQSSNKDWWETYYGLDESDDDWIWSSPQDEDYLAFYVNDYSLSERERDDEYIYIQGMKDRDNYPYPYANWVAFREYQLNVYKCDDLCGTDCVYDFENEELLRCCGDDYTDPNEECDDSSSVYCNDKCQKVVP